MIISPAIVINNWLITEDLVIILPVSASFLAYMYVIFYCMYLARQAWANSVDPDETQQNVASHQGLHCLPLIQQFLGTTLDSKSYLFKF